MPTSRRDVLRGGVLAVAAPFLLNRPARAAEVNLRLRHALPALDPFVTAFLARWGADIEAASGGRVAVEIASVLERGGAARQLGPQLRDGTADLAWIPVAESGRASPRIEVFHLPFLAASTGLANSQAVQDYAERHAREDVPDLQVLIAAAGPAGAIHATRPAATKAELAGLRLCPQSTLAGEALQALGAVAVSVAEPLLAEAFRQQILDGCVAPWGGMPEAAQATARAHTELPGSPGFSTAGFLLAMTKARFDALPEDVRQLLAGRSGQAGARLAGEAFDAVGAKERAAAEARKDAILQLAPEEKARWIEATRPVAAAWVERLRARGIDGNALLAEARAMLAKYEPTAPAPAAPAPAQPAAGPLPPLSADNPPPQPLQPPSSP